MKPPTAQPRSVVTLDDLDWARVVTFDDGAPYLEIDRGVPARNRKGDSLDVEAGRYRIRAWEDAFHPRVSYRLGEVVLDLTERP